MCGCDIYHSLGTCQKNNINHDNDQLFILNNSLAVYYTNAFITQFYKQFYIRFVYIKQILYYRDHWLTGQPDN